MFATNVCPLSARVVAWAAQQAAAFEKSPTAMHLALMALKDGPVTLAELRPRAHALRGPGAYVGCTRLAQAGLVICFGPEGEDAVYALSAVGLERVAAYYEGLAGAAREHATAGATRPEVLPRA